MDIEIKIPKTFKRYTPSVMKKLTKLGYFDDVDEINNKSHMIFGNVPHTGVKQVKEDFYTKTTETIGMWLSGGADSAILAYILCKKIKEENLDIKFQPLSVRRGRGWNPIYAGYVIDFIEDELDFKMNDHIIYYPDINDEHQREIKEFWDRDDENFREGLLRNTKPRKIILLSSDKADTIDLFKHRVFHDIPNLDFHRIDESEFPGGVHHLKYLAIKELNINTTKEKDFCYWGTSKKSKIDLTSEEKEISIKDWYDNKGRAVVDN